MSINVTTFDPFVSLIFGILIFIFPRFLNYLIGAYLVIIGLLGLGILG